MGVASVDSIWNFLEASELLIEAKILIFEVVRSPGDSLCYWEGEAQYEVNRCIVKQKWKSTIWGGLAASMIAFANYRDYYVKDIEALKVDKDTTIQILKQVDDEIASVSYEVKIALTELQNYMHSCAKLVEVLSSPHYTIRHYLALKEIYLKVMQTIQVAPPINFVMLYNLIVLEKTNYSIKLIQ